MERGLMSDATSTDDSPTPGYMLNELARSTTANYQANLQLQDFLVSRLAHKHHNVKWKSLVIIKHVCRTGRAEFKMEMARKTDAIKECLQFKGPPDPLRGDEPYRRVREAAKEALDAIFDSQMPITTSAVAAANRIQGMGNDYVPEPSSKPQSAGYLTNIVSSIQSTFMGDGSDAGYAGHPGASGSFTNPPGGSATYPTSSSSYASPGSERPGSVNMTRTASGGMVGLGNPNFKDARDEKTWLQKASDYANASISAYTANTSPSAPADMTYTTNRGPNAYDSSTGQVKSSFGGAGSIPNPWQGVGLVPDLPPQAIGQGRVGPAAADGSYERTLIESLCEPGGLKAVPPEPQLTEFLQSAATLSPELVGNCLLDMLNNDSWQSRVKALIVIASLVKAKDCAGHLEWWVEQGEMVRSLGGDSKAGVRSQVGKTLEALGLEDSSVSVRSSRSITPNPGPRVELKKEAFLLDMLDTEDTRVAHSPPPLPPAPAPSLDMGGELFAGLSISERSPGAPASNLSVFDMSAPLSPASTSASAPSTAIAFDFLGDSNPSASSAPIGSCAQPIDFFADLSSPAPLPTSLPTLGASSGFDFVNSSPSAPSLAPVNKGSAISSAFIEKETKPDPRSAFQEFALPSSAPIVNPSAPTPMGMYNRPPVPGVPVNNYPPYPYPAQAVPMAAQQGTGMQPSNLSPFAGMTAPRPGTSVLAPSMLNPTAPRKAIPTADSVGGANSGFSFMGGSAGGVTDASSAMRQNNNNNNLDSFSFVTDAMKDMTKK